MKSDVIHYLAASAHQCAADKNTMKVTLAFLQHYSNTVFVIFNLLYNRCWLRNTQRAWNHENSAVI